MCEFCPSDDRVVSAARAKRPRTLAATSGLGYRITTAQRFFQTDLIIGYILLLGCFGLATDQAMKALGRRMFRYIGAR